MDNKSTLFQQFLDFIRTKNLISPGQTVLLAVSGGMDSMVLVDLFRKSHIAFSVAHVNHNLRGLESKQDENFVVEYCKEHHLNYVVKCLYEGEISAPNLQEKARDLRYRFLEEARVQHQIDFIVTAHHKDDSMETWLINSMRGTGLKGLTGIPVINGHIIRPLLFTNRQEIHQYSIENNVVYREDSSNKKNTYTRNAIRNELMPILDRIDYRNRTGFYQTLDHLQETEGLFSELIAQCKNKYIVFSNNVGMINVQQINKYAFAPNLLYFLVESFGFSRVQVQDIFDTKIVGSRVESSNYILVFEKDYLNIYPKEVMENDEVSHEIDSIPFTIEYDGQQYTFSQNKNVEPSSTIGICIGKLTFPLQFRNWKNSDVFKPISMKGRSKAIKKILSEQKIPLLHRKNQKVLIDGSGEVIILFPMQLSLTFSTSRKEDDCLDVFINGKSILYEL
ncbi:MAG: tRNA lysidine(34) synthetase TilS [Saprospiraceae bacterium]